MKYIYIVVQNGKAQDSPSQMFFMPALIWKKRASLTMITCVYILCVISVCYSIVTIATNE